MGVEQLRNTHLATIMLKSRLGVVMLRNARLTSILLESRLGEKQTLRLGSECATLNWECATQGRCGSIFVTGR